VLEYLGRYVHRIAIANSRLESFDGESVVFRYRENRSGEMKRCRLEAIEFVRRFMQHVLPQRFVKVRSYRLFSSSCPPSLHHARESLAPASAARSSSPSGSDAPTDTPKETVERTCPHCGVGRMRIVAELSPTFTARAPLNIRAPP
jgi:hypothetical protein